MSAGHAVRPSPAHAALLRAPFCSQHTKVKRDETGNRLCEFGGCEKQAVFGSPVDRVTRFCGPHKKEGHVDVKNKLCEADGCEKQAHYGSEAEDLVRFCKPHSRDGDVDC